MSKFHGLNDLPGILDNSDESAYAQVPSFASGAGIASNGSFLAAAPLVQTMYVTEAGDSTAISLDDIHQGQMGDCYLLSSIGEIAMLKPSFIQSMIHLTGTTETVTMYDASNGKLPAWNTTAFKAVTEAVTNVFPTYAVNNGTSQDVTGNLKEIWPQVIEKAYSTLNGSYAAIANGGSPMVAMEELTGHAASYMSPASLSLASLQSLIKASDLIVMDTLPNGNLPAGLFNNHAYMFESVTGTGTAAVVHLANPWGFDQPAPILLSQLSKGICEVDIGHLS